MRKLSVEVNDTEICKRLDILMATSKDDLPLAQVNQLLADPKSFDPRAIPEPYTQYVRHFIYMVKRNGRLPSESRVSFGDGEEESHSRIKADSLTKKSTLSSKTSKSTSPRKKSAFKKIAKKK
ncbi:phosphatidylinositol phospholipase [Leptospira ilyithenensis]|uniref:phosphatidylinositol phospholipase n=1 Tax=Leptospira ilyithenensis TaxID=2484901 RepID=UPI003CCC63E9